MDLDRLGCCGVAELHGLQKTGRETMEKLTEEGLFEDFGGGFIMFTDVVGRDRDLPLARYIRRHKLGTVKRAGKGSNPNSGNHIRVWVWTVDVRATEKHLEKLDAKIE